MTGIPRAVEPDQPLRNVAAEMWSRRINSSWVVLWRPVELL